MQFFCSRKKSHSCLTARQGTPGKARNVPALPSLAFSSFPALVLGLLPKV